MNWILRLKQIFQHLNLLRPMIIFVIMMNGCEAIQPLKNQSLARVWNNEDPSDETQQLQPRDVSQFLKSVQDILPAYKHIFIEAASEHGLPWQLVASVAYQESHWNSEARSYTGVRGLMQLTEETADHMEVQDRRDPHQSIRGGTKYIKYLLNRMPKSANSHDRVYLALAAYNIGFAHLKDAQKLAEQMGRNPNSWNHLKDVLPLLADKAFSQRLEYGYARGYETVAFVERVKSFYQLMKTSG